MADDDIMPMGAGIRQLSLLHPNLCSEDQHGCGDRMYGKFYKYNCSE